MAVTVVGSSVKALPQNLEGRETVSQAVGTHEATLEPKFDGWRTLWIMDEDGKARIYTRTGNELTGHMPKTEALLSGILPPGTILDAEVVAFVPDGHGGVTHKRGPVASALGASAAKGAKMEDELTLVVFDLLQHGSVDARPLDFARRRTVLEAIFETHALDSSVVMPCPQIEATDENYDALIAAGYEGGVVKWLDAPYTSGARGKGQFKIKAAYSDEAIIVGYKPGTPGSSFDGLVGAVEFGQYDTDGVLVHRGRCSGMDFATRVFISKNKDACLGRVFEFSFLCVESPAEGAQYGAFRSPQFVSWRDDRDAESVVIQHPGS